MSVLLASFTTSKDEQRYESLCTGFAPGILISKLGTLITETSLVKIVTNSTTISLMFKTDLWPSTDWLYLCCTAHSTGYYEEQLLI